LIFVEVTDKNTLAPSYGLRCTLQTANKTGESTGPCLTPKVTAYIVEKKPSHFTHENI